VARRTIQQGTEPRYSRLYFLAYGITEKPSVA